jgi:hypothetical protein
VDGRGEVCSDITPRRTTGIWKTARLNLAKLSLENRNH